MSQESLKQLAIEYLAKVLKGEVEARDVVVQSATSIFLTKPAD